MADSSYMSGVRAALAGAASKSKKKAKPAAAAATANATAADATEDDDERGGRSAVAAAAAAAAAVSNGRLRWDAGKSVAQLTAARDWEIESDMISLRKASGGKRRRK